MVNGATSAIEGSAMKGASRGADAQLLVSRRRPSTLRTALTPSASRTASHASRCRPPRSTSILSPPTRSRSFQSQPRTTKRPRRSRASPGAPSCSRRYADRLSSPRSRHRILTSPVSRALTRSALGARQRTIACRSNRGRRPQSVRSLAARHYRVRAAQFDGRDGPHRSPLTWQDDPSTWPRRFPSPAALSTLF